MNIVPKASDDVEAINSLINSSDEEVEFVIHDLLEWLQDMNWPVAIPITEKISKLKASVLQDPLKEILQGSDGIWKYWILTMLIPKIEQDIVLLLHDELISLAFKPSVDDSNEEVDIAAKKLLNPKD